jgi:signal transduction histidine kinase
MTWTFGDFMVYATGNRFWFYFSLLGTGMAPAFMFHFVCALVRSAGHKAWIILVYTASAALALSSPLALFYPLIKGFVDGPYWNIVYFAVLVPFFLSVTAMVMGAMRRAQSLDERNRLWYILLAIIIAVITGLTDLVQILGVPVLPLGHMGCVVYSSVLAIGVYKHRRAYDVLAEMKMKVQALSEMATGIAHEIRNPLGSIKGAATLLARELKRIDMPDAQEYAELIIEESERLNNILANFQHFTKPVKLEKEPLSINQAIEKTMRLAEVDKEKMRIRLELSEDLPMIAADVSALKQVFLNLIRNAAEACDEGCELVVRTEFRPPRIVITFADNGRGVPQDIIGHIFEPFFTTKTRGMGVGLAISRSIIQAHGGVIEARNLSPHGTEFSIVLPA